MLMDQPADFLRYVDSVFKAMWVDSRNMGEPEVIDTDQAPPPPGAMMAKRTPALLDHYGIEVNASNLNIPAAMAVFVFVLCQFFAIKTLGPFGYLKESCPW